MTSRKPNFHEMEKQLNPLYYEISLLKFRVGEASPEVGTQYRDLISNLSAQYNFVATQVRSPKEMKKEPQEEQLILAEQHLQELRKNLDTIGQWIYLETANQVCAY